MSDTNTIQNEPTKASPISRAFAERIWSDFKRLYEPMDKAPEEDVFEADPIRLICYAAWWLRGNGHPAETHQVLTGWSKLRLTKDKYVPSETEKDAIKENGGTA